MALIAADHPCTVAGVFTTNRVKAAPVVLDIRRIARGISRGIIINSGNANACTGRRGLDDAKKMCRAAEKALGAKGGEVLVASTGVIGVPLPMDRIIPSVPRLVDELSPSGWLDAAEAIMTTDAFPKIASGRVDVDGTRVSLLGIAKGAGMICPNMATMLAFFVTDASVGHTVLNRALGEAVDASFNRITVDDATSTNDSVFVFANGLSGAPRISAGSSGYRAFTGLLKELSTELAHMIVRDGEGATKFLEIEVLGAATRADAERAVRAVSGSLLVKTAFFGEDPNWGRIIVALGTSGAVFNPDRVEVTLNGVKVMSGGVDTGKEKEAKRAIRKRDVKVRIELNAGRRSSRLWTTDLSHDYVRLNSAYRT